MAIAESLNLLLNLSSDEVDIHFDGLAELFRKLSTQLREKFNFTNFTSHTEYTLLGSNLETSSRVDKIEWFQMVSDCCGLSDYISTIRNEKQQIHRSIKKMEKVTNLLALCTSLR